MYISFVVNRGKCELVSGFSRKGLATSKSPSRADHASSVISWDKKSDRMGVEGCGRS